IKERRDSLINIREQLSEGEFFIESDGFGKLFAEFPSKVCLSVLPLKRQRLLTKRRNGGKGDVRLPDSLR
ncbi:MAG: hypothetical protein ACI4SY_06780, partial [Sutterella sp.]